LSIVTSASTVGSRGHHGAIPYILAMKNYDNQEEEFKAINHDVDMFIDSKEAFPELDLGSLLFFIAIQIISAIALFASLYYLIQGAIWLVKKMI
jgi:hypothetical protein